MICTIGFLITGSKFQIPYAMIDMIKMLSVNISYIAFITIKNIDHRCIIHNISKSEAINLFKISVFLMIVDIYIYIYIYIKKFVLDLVYSKEIFYCFCFAVYKMVDCEYSTNIYNVLNISIGTVMRNQETLKFVLDHLKNRKMCKHAVKNLLYRLRYVPDQ